MADTGPAPSVTVREERGVYLVSARFHVSEPPAIALAVLTDDENIPRFLPDVIIGASRSTKARGGSAPVGRAATLPMS